jgi:hypothetical protein
VVKQLERPEQLDSIHHIQRIELWR